MYWPLNWKLRRLRSFSFIIHTTLPIIFAAAASAQSQIELNSFSLAQANPPEFNYENYDFWADQCLTLTEQKQYAEALIACEKAIVLKPKKDNAEMWLARSQNLFQLGRYAETIVSLKQVIAAVPQHSGAMAYQCAALFQLQQLQPAIDHCEQALQTDGDWGTVAPEFAWYYHGLTLHALGRLETALTSFSQAVRLNPEDKLAKAECLSTALEINATEATICDPQAPIAVALSDMPVPTVSPAVSASPEATFQQTIRITEQALAIDPSRPEVWFQQGLALEQLGQYERALTAFDRALQLKPTSSLTLAHRCAVLNLLERYEPALEACSQALQADQRWGSLGVAYGLTQQSLALFGLGQLEAALAAVDQAVALESPYGAVALTQRSNILTKLKRYDEAIAAAQAAIKQFNPPANPPELAIAVNNDSASNDSASNDSASAATSIQSVVARLGNANSLSEAVRTAATQIATTQIATTQIATAQTAATQTATAQTAANQATANPLDPADAAALNSQAVSYWLRGNTGDYQTANDVIEAALISYKQPQILQETFESTTYVEPLALRLRGQILAQFNQGRIFSSLGKTEQAITAYEQALILYNLANQRGISTLSSILLAELWLNSGVAHLASNPDVAAQSFEKAVNLDSTQFAAWYNWAIALTRLREYDRATRAYDQAEQIRPGDAAIQAGRLQILLGRANVLAQQGKIQDAMALYDQVLKLDPTNQIAEQQLQQLIQSSVRSGR